MIFRCSLNKPPDYNMNWHLYQLNAFFFFLGELMSGAGMAGVTYFASNKDDPYITLADPVSQNSITGLDIY